MKKETQTYTFDANLDVLELIRNILNDLGKETGLDNKKSYQLKLAVDEIATNIIKHGYLEAGVNDGKFDLVIDINTDKIAVTLVDNGAPFNPLEFSTPTEKDLDIPLEERPIGGLGVMIAKQSVDEFLYKFENGQNKNIFIVYHSHPVNC